MGGPKRADGMEWQHPWQPRFSWCLGGGPYSAPYKVSCCLDFWRLHRWVLLSLLSISMAVLGSSWAWVWAWAWWASWLMNAVDGVGVMQQQHQLLTRNLQHLSQVELSHDAKLARRASKNWLAWKLAKLARNTHSVLAVKCVCVCVWGSFRTISIVCTT